ncbi:MAG: hypothetical protein JWO57_4156 [Pseudonocardiales bacterium]|nr:hypothetical protein [Pseudonocardiales bacterium]
MSRTGTLARKLRQRRDDREFTRALRTASPAMQQELMAAAARQNTYNR